MNPQLQQKAQWQDRHNGYFDLVVAEDGRERMLGMVDTTITARVRSFTRRADGTWKLTDHASLEDAKQEVECLAQI